MIVNYAPENDLNGKFYVMDIFHNVLKMLETFKSMNHSGCQVQSGQEEGSSGSGKASWGRWQQAR